MIREQGEEHGPCVPMMYLQQPVPECVRCIIECFRQNSVLHPLNWLNGKQWRLPGPLPISIARHLLPIAFQSLAGDGLMFDASHS